MWVMKKNCDVANRSFNSVFALLFLYLDILMDKKVQTHTYTHTTHVQMDNKVLTICAEVSPSSWISPDAFSSVISREVHYYCRRVSCFCTTINTLPLKWWTVRFPNPLQSRQILRTHWSKSVNVGMTALHPGNVKVKESCWSWKSDQLFHSYWSPVHCMLFFDITGVKSYSNNMIKCRILKSYLGGNVKLNLNWHVSHKQLSLILGVFLCERWAMLKLCFWCKLTFYGTNAYIKKKNHNVT